MKRPDTATAERRISLAQAANEAGVRARSKRSRRGRWRAVGIVAIAMLIFGLGCLLATRTFPLH